MEPIGFFAQIGNPSAEAVRGKLCGVGRVVKTVLFGAELGADRGGPDLHSTVSGDAEPTDGFDDPGGVLGCAGRLTGEHFVCGRFRVDRVVLALTGSGVRVGLADLNHLAPGTGERAGEAGNERAGRFDKDSNNPAERNQPVPGGAIVRCRGRERSDVEELAERVERRCGLEVCAANDPVDHGVGGVWHVDVLHFEAAGARDGRDKTVTRHLLALVPIRPRL